MYLKREDLQKTRSFKLRGSLNKIIKNYDILKSKDVVCASARKSRSRCETYTCSLLRVKGKIFAHKLLLPQKLKRIKHFGKDNIILKQFGDNFNQCLEYAQEYSKQKMMVFLFIPLMILIS